MPWFVHAVPQTSVNQEGNGAQKNLMRIRCPLACTLTCHKMRPIEMRVRCLQAMSSYSFHNGFRPRFVHAVPAWFKLQGNTMSK